MAFDVQKFIRRFVEEARDHVKRLGDGLAALGSEGAGRDSIDALFRSAHTIKGSARMLKLTPITDTAHHLEDVLGALREGSLAYRPELNSLLFRAVDAIAALVEHLAECGDPAGLPPADTGLCDALAAAARGEGGAAPAPVVAPLPLSAAAASPGPAPAEAAAASEAAAVGKLKVADTVRVRLSKLDELIKLMGEVVSGSAMLRQRLLDVRHIEREGLARGGWDAHKTRLHQFVQALRNDVQTQELLMEELHDKTLSMRMLPLAIVFDSAGSIVRDLARTVGKQIECVVSGAEIELDRQIIDRLGDPLIHLLRNAVDHGVEPPGARLAVGKPAHGRISLSAYQDGGWVVIEIADDGGGISLAAVREKSVRKNLVSAEKAATLSDQELIDLIFLPGFSTSPIITGISGRGVGMDVVKQCVVGELKGVVSVATRPGAGTTFTLRLPLSLAVMRMLLVEAGGLPFGFTAQYVAELIRVPRGEILHAAEREAVILRNEFVPIASLAELLRLPARQSSAPAAAQPFDRGLLLVVLQIGNEKLALEVNALLDERDMVIKPLPEHLRRLPLIAGMVVTAKNALVCVLHAPMLLDFARKARGQAAGAEAAGQAGDRRKGYNVLVVDDSLNTREIEKDVLEAWGYHVTLAEDGLDGLQKAQHGAFDAILTDVEMPNMDGFTLTSRLRQEEKYRDTPIVIITSREKEEDKRRGIQVGADAYIVKGDFDQSNLLDTLRSLLGQP